MIKIILYLFFVLLVSYCPGMEKLIHTQSAPPHKENNTRQVDSESMGNSQAQSAKTAEVKIPKQWVDFKKELKSRRNALTSPIVQRRLERIYRVMDQKDSEDKTLKLINKLENVVQKRPFELARLYKLKAQVYLSKEDLKKATLYYNKAMDLKVLPYKEHLSVIYHMATLNLMNNKVKKASYLIKQLFYLSDTPSPSAYILKAYILIEKKQKKQALDMVMKAIQSTSKPKEHWLAMAGSLNIEMERYVPAVRFLTALTALKPNKKQYWKGLSKVYSNLDKNDRALATLDLAYKLEFLENEQEILHLAGLLLHKGLAFKAGHLIEKSIKLKKINPTQKNYEGLGDCWIAAEETDKALTAYQHASSFAKDGKIFAKLGDIYMKNKNWKKAQQSWTKALEKGGIKHPEQIYISLGATQAYLKDYSKAIKSFEQVIHTKAKGQVIKTARQWINYTQTLLDNFTQDISSFSATARKESPSFSPLSQ